MPPRNVTNCPTIPRDELFNALTHAVGVVGSLVGGSLLIFGAAAFGDAWHVTSAVVFSVALLLLYTASTLYHVVQHRVSKARLRVLDHCAIFVLIAATYTPFALVTLRGVWGWTLFGLVWSLATAGVVFKIFCTGRFPRLSTAMYLGLGWLSVTALPALFRALSPSVLAWIVAGGLAYTAGTIFYHSRRIPYAHAIWHLFVLAGSTCHFVAVLTELVPRPLA